MDALPVRIITEDDLYDREEPCDVISSQRRSDQSFLVQIHNQSTDSSGCLSVQSFIALPPLPLSPSSLHNKTD